MNDDTRRVKVLYVAGSARSGSTILGNVLGQVEGFFHPGELYSIWDVGLARDKPCGCGRPLYDCAVWKPVLRSVFGEAVAEGVERMGHLKKHHKPRTHEVPLRFFVPDGQPVGNRRAYARTLERLYGAIQQETGCDWIVDTSKIPSHAYLLANLESVDVYVVHLVRDARAVAYSWERKAIDGFRPGFVSSMMRWNARNVVTELFRHRFAHAYLRLRYEDFATRPRAAAERLLDFIGESERALPFRSERDVELAPTHTVWGNPNRHRADTVEIALDEAWRTHLSLTARASVMALTGPLLSRYGYRLT